MKRSSVVFVLFFLLFIYINYWFLRPYFLPSSHDRIGTERPLTEDERLHEEYRKFAQNRMKMESGNTNVVREGKENLVRKKLFPFRRHEEIDPQRFDIRKEPEHVVRKTTKPPTLLTTTLPPQTEPSVKVATNIIKQPTLTLGQPVMALLVISCNRVEVKHSLDLIFKYKPADVQIPVIVSQDCGHAATARVIQSYGSKVTHIKQPDLGEVKGVPAHERRFMTYHKIARHYKFALGKVFADPNIDSVVIVEDDLDIAPDFFDYFRATRPLLDEDPTLFCVSAWNDNGKSDLIDIKAVDLLYRSDFFPGLGWLLTRKIWNEFADKWPLGFWDDWVRQKSQRKERACLRPEISRTRTSGRVGASQGQFFDQYLKYIRLNEQAYPFLDYDLNHLLKKNYDTRFLDTVYGATEQHDDRADGVEPIRITYHNQGEFERIARRYGMMTDEKEGVPRTAYLGVVTIFRNNRRIYIAPPRHGWKPY